MKRRKSIIKMIVFQIKGTVGRERGCKNYKHDCEAKPPEDRKIDKLGKASVVLDVIAQRLVPSLQGHFRNVTIGFRRALDLAPASRPLGKARDLCQRGGPQLVYQHPLILRIIDRRHDE